MNQRWLEDLDRFLHFIAKGRAFSKDRTSQDFKGGVRTLLMLILVLSATFSRHEELGQIFNGIKLRVFTPKSDGSNKLIHSAGTVSSHTKHTPSLLYTTDIPQHISCTFPFFGRCERNNYVLTDSTILKMFFPPCELLYLQKIGWYFRQLTVSKMHYKIWKELKKQ